MTNENLPIMGGAMLEWSVASANDAEFSDFSARQGKSVK